MSEHNSHNKKNAILHNKDIRNRLSITILCLIIFGIGSNIPVPGINHQVLNQVFNGQNSGLFDLFNLFTGGSFQNFTMFALGVTPYITASIIIQLFTIAFPYFENLAKEGETGRKKMATITRYVAILLALVQAIGLTVGLFRKAVIDKSAIVFVMIILLLTAGTAFLMWLGEQMTEYGIGNGMSLIIFAGIVARLPVTVRDIVTKAKDGTLSAVAVMVIILCMIVIVIGIIIVQEGVRKIPVQYAKRVVGRTTYGGENTHIPMKVNAAGVIPIIFALSILQFPMTLTYFRPDSKLSEWITKYLSTSGDPGIWIYMVLNVLLTIAFTFFYTGIVFKPDEIATNLAQSGGSIPGVRPGLDTQEYIKKVNSRLTLLSALFLSAVSILPTLVSQFTPVDMTFGGTSLLILVGVATETMKQIEGRMLMTKYRNRGFLFR